MMKTNKSRSEASAGRGIQKAAGFDACGDQASNRRIVDELIDLASDHEEREK